MRALLVVLVIMAAMLVAAGASAERPVAGTIGLYLSEDGNDLSRSGIVKQGDPFELVVSIDTDVESIAVVFQMTELNLLYPGVFKVSTWKYNDSIFGLGRNDLGEYAFPYGSACAPAGGVVVLRVGYAHVSGDLPNDIPLYIGGIPNDELHLPVLAGAPGYIDCGSDTSWSLALEPWSDESIEPERVGITETDGLLLLNPSEAVPVDGGSVSLLKTRY
jgi:hypothetical protein